MISYDGSDFFGFQFQPDKRTVAGELEQALMKMHKGERIRVHGSGRTDAGVHAREQVIHFDSDYQLPPENWKQALNTLLPADLYVNKVIEVMDTFHARYNAVAKEYHYIVWNQKEPNLFNRDFAYHFPYETDIEKINQACRLLEGTHDFTAFSSAKATVRGSKVRTLYHASCSKQDSELVFVFRGDGFLYKMVRILVGVLLDIGQGRCSLDDVTKMLEQKNGQCIRKTAPAHGLYLWAVIYDQKYINEQENSRENTL